MKLKSIGVRRLAAAAAALAAAGTGLAVGPGAASATAKATSFPLELTGDQPTITLFQSPTILCDECLPDDLTDAPKAYLGLVAHGTLNLHYEAPAMVTTSYDDSFLRQGSTLNLTDSLVMMPGSVHSVWHFDFDVQAFVEDADGNIVPASVDLDPIPDAVIPQDFACNMPVDGSTSCSPSSVLSLPIAAVDIFPGISVGLTFNVNATLDVASDGVVTVRQADVIGGQPGVDSSQLTFLGASPSIVSDPLTLGCDEPVGNSVTYSLTDPSYALQADMGLGLSLDVSFNHWFGSETIASLWNTTLASAPLDPVVLHGDDLSTELGSLGGDNLPPVADAGPSLYLGLEGSPISFNGDASTDNCGTPTLVWQFSDGGVGFGPHPTHTFADDGTYTALLTATDDAGNVDTDLVDVIVVLNQAPIVNAGPDTSAAWGHPVPFGGSAVDPGSADQASLTYSWEFGDGSPSAAGGPNTVHTYAVPGDYEATLKVCDKDGKCGTDTRTITVHRRAVTVSVVGPTSGIYDTPGPVSASVVDEFGAPVANRLVTFAVDGTVIGTAATNSTGVATLSYAPQVAAGAHTQSATTAQDDLYSGPAVGSASFTVAKKATIVTYTGALTGAPNKSVTLSATLVDGTGTPLAGRTVNFTLGSQTASATTNATGQAATTVKLTQKNGTYTVSATFSPVGDDAGRYNSSGATNTFKLQAK